MITLHLQDCVEIHETVSALYHQTGVGRPFLRCTKSAVGFMCMNPLQSALVSETEFLEMDVTFENCPYLLNIT